MKKIKKAQIFVLLALMGLISPVPATGQGLYTKKAVPEEEVMRKAKAAAEITDFNNPNDTNDDSLDARSEVPLKDSSYFFLLMGVAYVLIKGRNKTRKNPISLPIP